MCDRKTSLTDPTADFVLSDLLTATEDLIDFAINVFDTIRLQSHFNDRNRRISLGVQLNDVQNVLKSEFGFIDIPTKPCTVTTTLKYDLSLYLDRILQACKRTKSNLMLLRVSRIRSNNTTLLLVASTNVRVEQLNKKVQLLIRLVKENGGDFQIKKKKKKKSSSDIKQQTNKKSLIKLMSNEDLNDYVEIALSFRTIISKYREFIQYIRDSTKLVFSSNGQSSIVNSIILIPIAGNAINELNNILNRLIRIAYTTEAESNYLRQPPVIIDNKENIKRIESISDPSNSKENSYLSLKQNENQLNTRNQSAISNTNSIQFTTNMIANIFEDFFINTNDLFD